MWLVIGLLAGLVGGMYLPVGLPAVVARYHSVALLAALDSVFGAWRGQSHRSAQGAGPEGKKRVNKR